MWGGGGGAGAGGREGLRREGVIIMFYLNAESDYKMIFYFMKIHEELICHPSFHV